MSYAIRRYGVIGAGNMGSGIAQKIATEGCPVVLVDLDDEKVERGLGIIRKLLGQGVERGIFRPAQVEEILGRVEGTSDWSKLADVDLVVEAVFENMEVKKSVFSRLGEVCGPETILGTNTSSFYVNSLVDSVPNPERIVGLHYFFHPAKNRLVEVIGHEGTDPEALAAAWAAQEAIGKTPIASADAPGFVVNRFFVPWLNEAVRLLEEGIANVATIDAAAKKAYRIGMGPFELMNVTGVPIALHAATTLGEELGPFYAPAEALRRQVESGENWNLEGEVDESAFEEVGDRLLGVVFFIVGQIVDEKVSTVEDTDIGARVGLRWRLGPFQLLNRVGIDRARTMMQPLMDRWDLKLPKVLGEAPSTGIPIHVVSTTRRGKVDWVRIERPDAMNALNEDVVAQLSESVEAVMAAKGEGMVVAGSGKAFVAGADIKFFVDRLRADAFSDIYAFTEGGANLLSRFSGGDRAVVARVHGLSLGGGSELALACDYIVGSPKASFGFPETGIGIYPGLGGTHRLARRIGTPLAKYFIYTGAGMDASTALSLGVLDGVEDFAGLDAAIREKACSSSVVDRKAPTAPRDGSWQPVWDFFERYRIDQVLAGEADPGDDPRLQKAVKVMGYKSPNALRLTERLFDEGAGMSLDEALGLDLTYLEEIFAHPDALEGLSSLLEGRRPQFLKEES